MTQNDNTVIQVTFHKKAFSLLTHYTMVWLIKFMFLKFELILVS